MIIIYTKNKTIYYFYCPCQQNKKFWPSKKMLAWKTVHWEFHEELFSCAVFALSVFGGKVEAKVVKGGCISIFPQQEGTNLFPELFRRLLECTTAKHRGWDCAALLWRLTAELFSLKTPSFLLPVFLTPTKYFYITLKYLPSHLTLLQRQKLTQNYLSWMGWICFPWLPSTQFLW